ncbi:glycosyltransferase [Turicibacter sanguinis]|nr:glycosyltransferase [Turicibacter sanguinis]MTH11167.1 glycosyltransferase [Turicibacter sanguinis]MTH12678.1 glycosyltransferase [Turicibacter sanguinis]MTH21055.1 glycosyltransferase [Turicibacter sanguinis]MTH40689.1 glycosyltransferase [Turicibacter sanguinis]
MKCFKKITFIISSLNFGGAERVVSELANHFSHDSEVSIVLVSQSKVEYQLDDRVKLYCIEDYYDKTNNSISVLERIKFIRKCVKEFNPDIVVSFLADINIYSCIALACSKFPLILSERNDPNIDPRNYIKRRLRTVVYPLAAGYVFQTPKASRYFSKYIQKKSTIIPNPIKMNLPKPYEGERLKEIVAVGRLEPQKNYQLLIKTFAKFNKIYPEYCLKIYGEGSERKNLEEMVEKEQLTKVIEFKGKVLDFHKDIIKSSMYILTSDYEGMPNALMEAMALGLPCIATNVPSGGTNFLIDNEVNGIITPVGNSDLLLKNMIKLVENKNLSQKLSYESRKINSKFSLDNTCKLWSCYISEILE